MPHEPQTQELHSEMLILLKNFHSFCVENNIKYSLHGGTLLGAVREKGFIPWDDDMDITMTRKEFDRFITMMQKNKDLAFKYTDDAKSIRILNKSDSKIWIDLFIYDYITEKIFLQKIKYIILTFIKAWGKKTDTLEDTKAIGLYTGWKYIAVKIVSMFGTLFPESLKKKTADRVYKSFPGKKQLIHRANDQYIAIKLILPVSSMDQYILVEFEDTKLMITSEYDMVLRSSYGDDYMTPKKDTNVINAHEIHRKNHSQSP